MSYNHLLLHVPHASTRIPELYFTIAYPPSHTDCATPLIRKKSFYLVDYYTDELFVPQNDFERIHSLVFDWNRVLCDVERLPHDPLEAVDCGIYSCSFGYDYYGRRKRAKSMMRYLEHNSKLALLLTELHFLSNDRYTVLLIDCHSFSLHPTKLCPNPPIDIDICIGYNEDWSKPSEEVISLVERHFSERGYRVARNTPFSNSKTVETPIYYHSLMIEVSKRLYMNEDNLEKTQGFNKLQKDIQDLYPLLLKK